MVKVLPPPTDETNTGKPQNSITPLTTDADRLRQTYKQIGEEQKLEFGTGLKPPDFSKVPNTGQARVAPTQPPKQTEAGGQGGSPGVGNSQMKGQADRADKTAQAAAPGSRESRSLGGRQTASDHHCRRFHGPGCFDRLACPSD